MDTIEAVREFNRFYTRRIGLLEAHLPATRFSLAEARVLYELAQAERTAADLGRALGMDKGHLSRIVARFRAAGLVRSRPSPGHARHLLLSPTDAGREAFATMDQGTRDQVDALLATVGSTGRRRLVGAMQEIRTILHSSAPVGDRVRLRGPEPGDLGWITHRQAVLYHAEYGWDWTYEGLVASILGAFAAGFDAGREDAFVAEADGRVAGSVFLMRSDDPAVAKLRLLYVEPFARGMGLGGRLVATCIERARALGYRDLTLWTNDVLVSARRLYEAAGFRLVETAPHRSFGRDLLGQTWTLRLAA